MYLKRLTLRGFKSFASTTTLMLEPGIICVVGPNGSGKSNVVDALSWVMGEQGHKSLRGGSMEDVIFAGAGTRAPLGRAEVQLTIDNSDGALPIDYTEVTISRTRFRNGSSEYSINGTQCRLIDVRELLSDSGIGHEMHVVVGQGRLDAVLSATPETRREFVEEAAGIHKHRERKEKALRKLDATEANLHRLTDLIAEIRRQLKPLGRQAEVAKRASLVQADLRDAKARLLADDLVQARSTLALESADEENARARRHSVESSLTAARTADDEAQDTVRLAESRYRAVQETWFSLSGITERVRSTVDLASERVNNAQALPVIDSHPSRDPETLRAQAEEIRRQEENLKDAITGRRQTLDQAQSAREAADIAAQAAEQELIQRRNLYAERRELVARLSGQLVSVTARIASTGKQIATLEEECAQADLKAERAEKDFSVGQAALSDADPDELTSELGAAEEQARLANQKLNDVRDLRGAAEQELASIIARIDTWKQAATSNKQAESWVLTSGRVRGVIGSVASLLKVEKGYETAVAAALGVAANAVAIDQLHSVAGVISTLKAEDKGHAAMVISSAPDVESVDSWPKLPPGIRYAITLVSMEENLTPAMTEALSKVVVVDTAEDAARLVAEIPGIRVVTRDGDTVSSWFASGGSSPKHSMIQVASALADAEKDRVSAEKKLATCAEEVEEARRHAHECDTRVTCLRSQLREFGVQRSSDLAENNALQQAARLARNDFERLQDRLLAAQHAISEDRMAKADLESRIAEATHDTDQPPDSAQTDRLLEIAKQARSDEMEARLGLRTLEERVRSLAGQAKALIRQAEEESRARGESQARRAAMLAQAERARVVAEAGAWLAGVAVRRLEQAEAERAAVREEREAAEAESKLLRVKVRELSAELEVLVDSVHRDELSRTQQKMRIDALAERALAEVGIDVDTLVAQYGPDQSIPPEDSAGDSVAYVREEQLKRLRRAERDLQLLGRINPLALEEFDAMQERHNFLANQLEDLKSTRADLLSIIDEVDARVQEVFASAYADVETQFADTFSRLFPGGEGRLVLTEPGQWLTTGIDIEARPVGKKVTRLSLLSGGERALVAVCFLVALFKARPSPFYVLDEVEAALDDTNLSRLLDIYAELRSNSQLVVITHQKRTMEIADVLYGVTMGSDGVSTVVSQRMLEN